jgi:hypothetical protein
MNRRREFVSKIWGGNFSVELSMMIWSLRITWAKAPVIARCGPTASTRSGERRGFCSRTGSRSPNIESSSRAKIFARSQKKSLPAIGSSRLESCGVGHRFVTDSFHGLFASHRSHLNRTVRIANFAPMPLCLIQASSCSALITNKYFSFHWQVMLPGASRLQQNLTVTLARVL